MMNKSSFRHIHVFDGQQGAAILLTVVLLLIMVTLVTLYTGKIQSFEHRIVVSNQNLTVAEVAAKAALQQGFAMLRHNPNALDVDVVGSLENNSSFVLTSTFDELANSRKLISISAQGRSVDDLAHATMAEQVLVYPVLFNQPPAPLMVLQGFANNGMFEIVGNPFGLGGSQPLSLWSATTVNMAGTGHHSCVLLAFNIGNCISNAYSDHNVKHIDIQDGSASFPTDVLAYLFNIPTHDWFQLQQQADFLLADCNALDTNSWGLIWVSGDCEVSASTNIGNAAEPVILVVFDGKIDFATNVELYGLLLSFKSGDSSNSLGIDMQQNSAVFGAIVANYELGSNTGETTRVVYDDKVLQNLQSSSKLQRVARVVGSWHDF